MEKIIPKQLDQQLNAFFHKLYRDGRNRNHRFYNFCRGFCSSETFLTCRNDDTMDYIIIRVSSKDWPNITWDILGHNEEAINLCKPICQKYVEDMMEYYKHD